MSLNSVSDLIADYRDYLHDAKKTTNLTKLGNLLSEITVIDLRLEQHKIPSSKQEKLKKLHKKTEKVRARYEELQNTSQKKPSLEKPSLTSHSIENKENQPLKTTGIDFMKTVRGEKTLVSDFLTKTIGDPKGKAKVDDEAPKIDQVPHQMPIGLTNGGGNDCFLNATLQMIVNTPGLTKAFPVKPLEAPENKLSPEEKLFLESMNNFFDSYQVAQTLAQTEVKRQDNLCAEKLLGITHDLSSTLRKVLADRKITSSKAQEDAEETFTNLFSQKGTDKNAAVYHEVIVFKNGKELKIESDVTAIQVSLGEDWRLKKSFEELLKDKYFVGTAISQNLPVSYERKFKREPEVLIFQIKRFATVQFGKYQARIDRENNNPLYLNFGETCDLNLVKECLCGDNNALFYKIPEKEKPIYLLSTANSYYQFKVDRLYPLSKEAFEAYFTQTKTEIPALQATLISPDAKAMHISDPIPYLRPDLRIAGEHILGGKSANYEVTSFVQHSGGLSYGHYIAYVKVGGIWFQINDSKLQSVSQKQAEAALQESYLICAQKKPEAAPAILPPVQNLQINQETDLALALALSKKQK